MKSKNDALYRKDVLRMLSKGISTEELGVLYALNNLKKAIRSSPLDAVVKTKLLKHVNHLIKDTIRHAALFGSLIKKYKV